MTIIMNYIVIESTPSHDSIVFVFYKLHVAHDVWGVVQRSVVRYQPAFDDLPFLGDPSSKL